MMNNPKIQVEVDPTEDTEWNDILREKGIIPEKPPSPTDELENALEEAIQKQRDNRLESKDLDELAELEDEEDEDFLESYKAKRMAEMKALAERKRFGHVFPVSKDEYEKEVTKASSDCFVLLHMSLSSNIQSRLLSALLTTLAEKYPEIKFCDIPSLRCVENYPEANCPTILIYHKEEVVKQFIKLTMLGGNDTKIEDLEKVLVDIGAVSPGDKRLVSNQEDEGYERARKLKFIGKSIKNGTSHDDSDDDFYD